VTPSVLVTDAEAIVETEEGADAQAQPAPDQPKKDEEDVLLKKAVEVLTKGKQATASAPVDTQARPGEALPVTNPLTIKK
jgi:hypothetical protein